MYKNLGLIYAIVAYAIWGVVPIYWKQLVHVDSLQIVAHRLVWSFVFVILLIVILRQLSELKQLFRQKRLVAKLFVASLLMSFNWGVYIWAVNAGYIVEVSMGYFINPLVTVLLGVVIFHERLRSMQIAALLIVVAGVAYSVFAYDRLPWIALTLAGTFACYSAVKKSVRVSSSLGIALECGFAVLPALFFLAYIEVQNAGSNVFGNNIKDDLLLILGGLVSLTPLLLFAAAAKKISLTALGMSQYIGPTLQLAIGVYLYREPFDQVQFISFGLIWLALLIYSVDQFNFQRRSSVVAAQ